MGTTAMAVSVRSTGRMSSPHVGRESTTAGASRASPVPSHIIGFHFSLHNGRGDAPATTPPGPAFAGGIHHA